VFECCHTAFCLVMTTQRNRRQVAGRCNLPGHPEQSWYPRQDVSALPTAPLAPQCNRFLCKLKSTTFHPVSLMVSCEVIARLWWGNRVRGRAVLFAVSGSARQRGQARYDYESVVNRIIHCCPSFIATSSEVTAAACSELSGRDRLAPFSWLARTGRSTESVTEPWPATRESL